MVENCPTDSDQGSMCEYLVVEKIMLYDTNTKGWKKRKMKKRIAAITSFGIFELYKDTDKSQEKKNEKKANAVNTIEGLRSYKSIVLKQFNVEIARRREKTGYDISLIDVRKPSRRLLFHVLYQIEKWLKAFHEHAASCPPKLPPYVPDRKEMKKDEEIVSATLEVLLPIWETRFVTLVGNKLTVYKGKDANSDVFMSSNLKDMIVQPTKDAYFQISEKYDSDTKAYNHILGLKTTKTKNPATWLKQLSTFYEKGTPSTIRRTIGQSSLPTMSSPNPSPMSIRREISDPTGKTIPPSPSIAIRSPSLQRLHRSGTHTTITTTDSLMQSIDEEDLTLENENDKIGDADSSTGYISPSDIVSRPKISHNITSPAETITLQEFLDDSEKAEGRQTPENIDEIEVDINNSLKLDETQMIATDKVAAWMNRENLGPIMEDYDPVGDYLRNPMDFDDDSDRSSGVSENSKDDWLKESFSAANSYNLNSSNVFRERPVARPKKPQVQNVFTGRFDEFDGEFFEHRTFHETFSSEFDFGTQFGRKNTKTTTEVFEQFVPCVREESWKKTIRVETKEESEILEAPPRRIKR